MKTFFLLTIIIIAVGCGITANTININNLNKEQKKLDNFNTKEPGKCYAKMKYPDGEIKWTEIVCGDNKLYYQRAQIELTRLGFKIDEDELNKKEFGKSSVNALRKFQELNNFARGPLDEATLWKLINS